MARIDNIKIYIEDAGTAASSIDTTNVFDGQITSVSRSGGEESVESEAAFNGFIKNKPPRSIIEWSMDLAPTDGNDVDWTSFLYGEDTGAGTTDPVYTSSISPTDKLVVIEEYSEGSVIGTHVLDNASVTSPDETNDATDVKRRSLTFSAAPQTESGMPNYSYHSGVDVESLPDLTTLTPNA
jgi:hypothetical protein